MIRSTVACALFAVLQTLSAGAESVANGNGSTPGSVCEAEFSELASRPGFHAMRIIEDSATHGRWVLERNVDHPAWPAVLTPIVGDVSRRVCPFGQREMPNRRPASKALVPIVHVGDALVVVEDARAWHAEMEAVALTFGSPGDSIMVRMRIGGLVTRATVVSKGRAAAANRIEIYR